MAIKQITSEAVSFVKSNWLEVGVVVFLLLVSFIVRIQGIDRGLWQDEAYTIAVFVDSGPLEIIAGDSYKPNNHILYTLTIWAVTSVVGFSEIAVRLPNIIATVVSFLVIYIIARRFFNIRTGLVALSIISLGSFHIFPTSTARGYGFLLLFSTLFTFFTLKFISSQSQKQKESVKRDRTNLALATLFAFLGIYTYPAFIGPVIFTLGVLLLLTRSRQVLLAGIAGSIAVLVAFIPLVNGVVKYYLEFGGGFKKHESVGWHDMLTLPIDKLGAILGDVFAPIFIIGSDIMSRLNLEGIFMVFLSLVFIYGLYATWRQKPQLFYILFFPPLLFIIASILFSVPIGSRSDYTIFLEPNYLILLSAGISYAIGVAEASTNKWSTASRRAVTTGTVVLTVVLATMGLRASYYNAVENRVPIDNAKSSIVSAKNACTQKKSCTIIMYTRSISYELYAAEVLEGDTVTFLKASSPGEVVAAFDNSTDKETILIDEIYKKEPFKSDLLSLEVVTSFDSRDIAKETVIYRISRP